MLAFWQDFFWSNTVYDNVKKVVVEGHVQRFDKLCKYLSSVYYCWKIRTKPDSTTNTYIPADHSFQISDKMELNSTYITRKNIPYSKTLAVKKFGE